MTHEETKDRRVISVDINLGNLVTFALAAYFMLVTVPQMCGYQLQILITTPAGPLSSVQDYSIFARYKKMWSAEPVKEESKAEPEKDDRKLSVPSDPYQPEYAA